MAQVMCGVYRSGGSGYGGPAANEKFYDPERVILSIKIPDNIILCTNIARFSQSYDKEQIQNIDALPLYKTLFHNVKDSGLLEH